MDDTCEWVDSSVRIVMVPTAIIGAYHEPFRLAEHGEPQTPAVMEHMICILHEETDFMWRPIDPERLPALQQALDMGCDSSCHCVCHEGAA